MKIFLIGFMGSGKTSLGKRLANRLNLEFIDLDQFIEEKYNMSVSSIFEQFGELVFRELETLALKAVIGKDNFVLSCGGGTPCFNSNIQMINEAGISIYIKMNETALVSRLQNSPKKRPLLDNLSNGELLIKISELLGKREYFYNQAKYTIDGINVKIDDIIEKILQKD